MVRQSPLFFERTSSTGMQTRRLGGQKKQQQQQKEKMLSGGGGDEEDGGCELSLRFADDEYKFYNTHIPFELFLLRGGDVDQESMPLQVLVIDEERGDNEMDVTYKAEGALGIIVTQTPTADGHASQETKMDGVITMIDGVASFSLCIIRQESPIVGRKVKVVVESLLKDVSSPKVAAESRSFPLYSSRLEILTEPPELFYKDEGGKGKCMEVKVKLDNDLPGSEPMQVMGLPLAVRVVYENETLPYQQDLLSLHADSGLKTDQNGEAILKYRIEEVSKNHRGQKFKLQVRVADAKVEAKVAPVTSAPVLVLSKRKNKPPNSSSHSSLHHHHKANGESSTSAGRLDRRPSALRKSPAAPPVKSAISRASGGSGPSSMSSSSSSLPSSGGKGSLTSVSLGAAPTPSSISSSLPLSSPSSSSSMEYNALPTPPPPPAAGGIVGMKRSHPGRNDSPSGDSSSGSGSNMDHIRMSSFGGMVPSSSPVTDHGNNATQLAKWVGEVVQYLNKSQWQVVGWEGRPHNSIPILRCPSCRQFRDAENMDAVHRATCIHATILNDYSNVVQPVLTAFFLNAMATSDLGGGGGGLGGGGSGTSDGGLGRTSSASMMSPMSTGHHHPSSAGVTGSSSSGTGPSLLRQPPRKRGRMSSHENGLLEGNGSSRTSSLSAVAQLMSSASTTSLSPPARLGYASRVSSVGFWMQDLEESDEEQAVKYVLTEDIASDQNNVSSSNDGGGGDGSGSDGTLCIAAFDVDQKLIGYYREENKMDGPVLRFWPKNSATLPRLVKTEEELELALENVLKNAAANGRGGIGGGDDDDDNDLFYVVGPGPGELNVRDVKRNILLKSIAMFPSFQRGSTTELMHQLMG